MLNSPLPEPPPRHPTRPPPPKTPPHSALQELRPSHYPTRPPPPEKPPHPALQELRPSHSGRVGVSVRWLLLLGGVAWLAAPSRGGETWGEVSMCPWHCVCRNLSESLSTLCVNKGLLTVPPQIDRRTVELRLNDNHIAELRPRDFANMSGLVELALSRNALLRLRPLGFGALESLRALHLDANRLTRLGARDLQGLASLQHLILSNNQLSAIAPAAFHAFLPALEDLDLSYNNLREAPWGALTAMPALHTLSLDHNLIEAVPEGALRELRGLGRLDMTSNRLRTLAPGPAPSPAPSPGPAPSPTPTPDPASSLSFGGNPLHCNCQLLWLRRQLRPDAMETCASPAPLAGRYFWAVPEAEFTCEAPRITRYTAQLWALEGQRATLRCRATGDPPPRVHWVAPDDRILANSSRVRCYGNGTLDVLVTRARDDGSYTCVAVNAAGRATAPAHLHVLPLPHHRGNRTRDTREPSDISAAARGGAGGPGEEPGPGAGAGEGRVGVQEVTDSTAEVRWSVGGRPALEYPRWMFQIQYNSTADETLMYRILPPSSVGFRLRNLVSAADYRLCVLAVSEEGGVSSLAGARVLGCASFSTRAGLPRCRTLHAHFLGGALSVLVGGAVVVMLLVFTVATMVRHHQHQWACGRRGYDDNDDDYDKLRGRKRAGGGASGQGAESPRLVTKGTSVYSQTNGEGGVTMVVLPKNTKHKAQPATPTELGRGGASAGRRGPPYSPESERVTLYYPGPASSTLPSKLQRAGALRGGAWDSPALPEPSPLRSNRSCSFDMGEVPTATRHAFGKRPGGVWTRRSPSLQGMLVPCDSEAHTAKGPAHKDKLEESVV